MNTVIKDGNIKIHRLPLFNAANNLKSSSFKVWLYLTQFDNNPFVINRRNIMECMGVSKNSYTRAIQELKDKGYLIKRNNDTYVFYENPKSTIDLP